MRKLLLIPVMALISLTLSAQSLPPELPPHLEGNVTYPVFDFNPFVGVINTENTALNYDPDLTYKVVIDVYNRVQDSSRLHMALFSAARTYNLIIANGVPQENVHMAIIVHGGAVNALLTEEEYKKKYHVSNPNLEPISMMKQAGVNFYVCGQNLGFLNLPQSSITKDVEVTLSAKTTIITLDQMGYTYMNLSE